MNTIVVIFVKNVKKDLTLMNNKENLIREMVEEEGIVPSSKKLGMSASELV